MPDPRTGECRGVPSWGDEPWRLRLPLAAFAVAAAAFVGWVAVAEPAPETELTELPDRFVSLFSPPVAGPGAQLEAAARAEDPVEGSDASDEASAVRREVLQSSKLLLKIVGAREESRVSLGGRAAACRI